MIQTYAYRLRYNQSKNWISFKFTAPEITPKQGLPALLYVKDEVIKRLASACKYILIANFVNTMPNVKLIRMKFILQIQLLGG